MFDFGIVKVEFYFMVTFRCGCLFHHDRSVPDDGYRGYYERTHAWVWLSNHAGPIVISETALAMRKAEQAKKGKKDGIQPSKV